MVGCLASHPAATGLIGKKILMLPRLNDSALSRDRAVESLIVDRIHLVRVGGKLELQKVLLPGVPGRAGTGLGPSP